MKIKLKSLLLTGAVAIVISLGLSAVAQNQMSGFVSPTPAPTWSLTDNIGRPITLQSASTGKKATLLNFWFAACPPCQEEFPVLEELYKENSAKGLEIVAINATDDAKTMQNFISKNGLSFRFARDADGNVSQQYNVVATPTNILIDANGRIIWRGEGLDETGLRQAVASALS